MAAFETTEYRERVQRVAAGMEAAGIDTLVAFTEPHMCYLTGYEGRSDYVPQVTVVRAGDQDARIILREMDIHCANPTVYLDPSRIECYPESYIGTPGRSPWEVIGARILEIAGSGRSGIEFDADNFSFGDHRALMKALGDRPIVDGSHVVTRAMIEKSPAERNEDFAQSCGLFHQLVGITPLIRQHAVAVVAGAVHDDSAGAAGECGVDL